jgi:small conductance mechanosensitive channel
VDRFTIYKKILLKFTSCGIDLTLRFIFNSLSQIITAMKKGQENTDKVRSSDRLKPDELQENRRKIARKNSLRKILLLVTILSATLVISTVFLRPLLPLQELIYVQAAEVAIIGYIVLETVSKVSYKLILPGSSLENARAIRSLVKIIGTIIIVASIISILVQNPIVAASISTISALVVGFAAQNILANMISGLYLSVVRPFKIGDRITISSNSGIIYDIELLYTRLLTENGDIVLVPSSSMVSSTIMLQKNR